MRTARGVKSASRSVALEPNDPQAWIVKGHLDQRRFRNVAAIAAATEAVRLAPKDPAARLALGEFLLGGGMVGSPDFVRAEEELREARRLVPQSRPAQFLLAKTLVLAGNDEGEAMLDSLLTEGPAPAEARFLRGLSRARHRDLAGADEDFRRAAALEPWRAATWFNWSKLLERLDRKPEADASRQRFEIAQQIEEGTKALEVPFHSSEDNVAPGIQLGDLMLRSGRANEAAVILESLAEDHPELPMPSILHAEALLAVGDVEGAAKAGGACGRGCAESSAGARRRFERGGSPRKYARKRSRTRAVRWRRRRLPRMRMLRSGRRLLESGDAVAALRELQVARQIASEDVTLLGDIGVALTKAQAWEDAEQALGAALAQGGANPEWLFQRGVARAAMSRHARAVEDFRRVLELKPGDSAAAAELAKALRAVNRGGEADSAEKAIAASAKSEEELRTLRERLAKDPKNVDRAIHLAKSLDEVGRSEEAERMRARAFALEAAP